MDQPFVVQETDENVGQVHEIQTVHGRLIKLRLWPIALERVRWDECK